MGLCCKGLGLNELALFAGAGGGILGGKLLGWKCVCAVEIDDYARSVLIARQNDGSIAPFPIWDDIRTFDGGAWRGVADVVSGGFPCNDISSAGKGAGIDGDKSGLWSEMARVIRDVEPEWVFVENTPMLTTRGLGRVLGDLAEMGFDAEWGVVGANASPIGAPHQRDRIWLVARHPDRKSQPTEPGDATQVAGVQSVDAAAADAQRVQLRHESGRRHGADGQGAPVASDDGAEEFVAGRATESSDGWWSLGTGIHRVAPDVAHRVDRHRCIGNGQLSAMVPLVWKILTERLEER